MAQNSLDMIGMFGQIANSLAENKQQLNKADDYNHDHGDNMVTIFNMITEAMQEKKSASPSTQLEYAAKQLQSKQSGSAQLYAQGLAQAAQQFQGKQVTPDNALQLAQALLSGGQAAQSGGGSGDALGSLLGGLLGGQGGSQGGGLSDGLDAGDLLNAGMAFLNAKQQGDSNVDALIDAVISASAMGSSAHRTQSSQLVLNTLMDYMGKMNK